MDRPRSTRWRPPLLFALAGGVGVALSPLAGCSSDSAAPGGSGGKAMQEGSGGADSGGAGGVPSSSSGGRGAGGNSSSSGGAATGGAKSDHLADKYPGDVGLAKDPAVVWSEDFEEADVATMFARYDDSKQDGLSFDGDVPAKSAGKASAKLTASGDGPNAVDFFKKLPDTEEAFIRYYVKYESDVPWHHTGVWVGGYNPASRYPNPQAGLKPNGDDRFSVSLEPMERGTAPRMDFYNYWMKMHSWMDMPTGNTAYYGNSLIHDPTVTAKNAWQCIELHIKLNPDPGSGAGAELGVWIGDASVIQFSDSAPLGYWIKDKFCPDSAVGTECTDYRPANPTLVPLDLQFRSTSALKINAFWPQNYITDPGSGSVWYDDMVVAKTRLGCLR